MKKPFVFTEVIDVPCDAQKGRGAGTRTLYTSELPHCMAKSRSTQEAIPVEGDGSAVWAKIVGEVH